MQSKHEPTLFSAYSSAGELIAVCTTHVDDCLLALGQGEECELGVGTGLERGVGGGRSEINALYLPRR